MVPGDSRRGAKVFENQQCIHCHAVNGRGGKMGLDLGRSVSRSYTPARLASTMWNHAPVMWSAIEAGGIRMPRLAPKDAADLFAFFYSTRFFDSPGDATRGKATFGSAQCGQCHGITASRAEGATPVAKWESLGDPVLLVQQMWNHSYRMRMAFARQKLEWQQLTSEQLNDILTYLRTPAGDPAPGLALLQHFRRQRRIASSNPRAASTATSENLRWRTACET